MSVAFQPAAETRVADTQMASRSGLTVEWLGDSNSKLITFADWKRNAPAGSEVFMQAAGGSKVEDFQADLSARVSRSQPDVVVVAQGTNNALDGGWENVDEDAFAEMLRIPSPDTCVVVVLGGYGPDLDSWSQQWVEHGRTRMGTLADRRPNTVVVDWGQMVAADPDLMWGDGIHLDVFSPALQMVADMVWDGVSLCD